MGNLVFLETNRIDSEPFTTSKVVAEATGVSHRYVKKQIVTRKKQLETFGLLVAYATESTGGRPEEIFRLNEQQATLLITFLKNTSVVVAFKTELVRQFFLMREELSLRKEYRVDRKPIHRSLTDALKEKGISSDSWSYKHHINLAYKTAIGKTAAQLRKERGAPQKAKAIDYMTAEEIFASTKAENQIAVLVELGMDYAQVKMMLSNSKTVSLTA